LLIAKTDFQYDSARKLVEYIKEDKEQPVLVKDHTGKELDQAELETFVEASEHYGVERHMIIAPDPDAEFDPSEVDRLPALKQLPAVTAAGRSEDIRALVGVQTVGQLEARYDKHTDGILGNCPQGVYFSPGESESIEHTQSEVGIERQVANTTTIKQRGDEERARSRSRSRTRRETDRRPIPSAALKRFGAGECIVKSREHWWQGKLHTLEDVDHRLDLDPTLSAESDTETAEVEPQGSESDTATTADEAPGTDGPQAALDTTGEQQDQSSCDDSDIAVSGSSDLEADAIAPDSSGDHPPHSLPITDQYPTDLIDHVQWYTWKADDGRKIPRAPWLHRHPDHYASAQNPDVWRSFEEASEYATEFSGHNLAFVIRDRDQFPNENVVLIDYDDVRNPDTLDLHSTVREHIEQADSFAQVSTSRTGVHILCRGELPEGVKTIDAPLPDDPAFPDAEIEVYDSARFVAMTGQHIATTPSETTECQAFLDDLAEDFATVTDDAPDQLAQEPDRAREEIEAMESTHDIDDIFDAIQHTKPRDIRLRSTVTEERADASKSLDPSWADSESGTRLAQLEDGWIYRKGMHGLDALHGGRTGRGDHHPSQRIPQRR